MSAGPGSAAGPSSSTRFAFTLPEGLVLRGERWGAGRRAITFVHGSGLVVESYRPAFAALADRAQVHALNARGHGGSDCPEAFTDYDAPVADLRRFIEERLSPPVVLAGHSYGALLSLRLAAEAPELAAGLLLLDPLVPWRRRGEWLDVREGASGELIAATRTRRERWSSRAEAAEWLRARGVYRPWTDAAFAAFLESGLREVPGGVALACPPWMEAAVYEGRPGPEIFAWAERLRVPAVILRGADSAHCIAEGAEDLANASPRAAVLAVCGGHTFPQEHPEATGRALLMALDVLERLGV